MQFDRSILIRAPLAQAFSTVAQLDQWRTFVPQCRELRFLSAMPWGGIVKAEFRTWFSTARWIAVYAVDPENRQLRFEHLSAPARGLRGLWSFTETEQGLLLRVTYTWEAAIWSTFTPALLLGLIVPAVLDRLRTRLET